VVFLVAKKGIPRSRQGLAASYGLAPECLREREREGRAPRYQAPAALFDAAADAPSVLVVEQAD
jgi:hypothetical protein